MKNYIKLLLLSACLCAACSDTPSDSDTQPQLLNSNEPTIYSMNGGFTGGSFKFYRDSTYRFYYWSDDMTSCVDSGKFTFSSSKITFRSILQKKSNDYYEKDTCKLDSYKYALEGTVLYPPMYDGQVNRKTPYEREDASVK